MTIDRALIVQFFKFGIVGTTGFLVDAGVLTLAMKIFGLGPYVGRLISFLIAVSVTWIGNRLFTFRRKGTSAAHIEWAKFALVCAIGFALNFGTYAALIAGVPFIAHAPVFGVAVGSLVAMFFNFFAARRLVFR